MINKTYLTYLAAVAVGVVLGVVAAPLVVAPNKWRGQVPPLQELEEGLPQISLKETLGVAEASPSARVRVLNGRVVGVYERENPKSEIQNPKQETGTESAEAQEQVQSVRLTGLRVLGEMVLNCGDKETTAEGTCRQAAGNNGNVTPILRFYDADDQLITTKVAQWNDESTPLPPGEVMVYDVVVPDPPKSETISIEMRTEPIEKGWTFNKVGPLEGLKIKGNRLEPGEYERKDPKTKEKIKIKYYKFSGTLVNTADFDVVSPTVYVWIKNDKNEVIGLVKKVFFSDVLTPGQELAVNLLVLPVAEEKAFSHEVRVFGERL